LGMIRDPEAGACARRSGAHAIRAEIQIVKPIAWRSCSIDVHLVELCRRLTLATKWLKNAALSRWLEPPAESSSHERRRRPCCRSLLAVGAARHNKGITIR